MARSDGRIQIDLAPAFRDLVKKSRYKIYYGGRGGAKSWQFARLLIAKAHTSAIRVLCTREYQSSIADSVHKILSDQIFNLGLSEWFDIQNASITSRVTGSEFIFKGLRRSIMEIKSTEGIDICWVEEAQSVSEESWSILIPTIRKPGSEIWVSFNTGTVDDATYQRFIVKTPPSSIVRKVGYQENPYFPDVLNEERLYLKEVDYDAYLNVWEGEPMTLSDACVLFGKYSVEAFETPDDAKFRFGADWGFSTDPTTLVRSYVQDQILFIDYEAYGLHVELDNLGALFSKVPESKNHIIWADNARPDTISHVKKQGFMVRGAPKTWKKKDSRASDMGSIKEGIAYLRSFKKIVIHERCKHTAQEARFWRYKTDPNTNEVLPVLVDKDNHCWDAIRYGHQQLIHGGVDWEALVA